jgi:hypothetical protein
LLIEEKERPKIGSLLLFVSRLYRSHLNQIFIHGFPPQPTSSPCVGNGGCNGGTRMKRTLAVLATVAAVGATTVTTSAPAEARGIGPGLAFGLAAGAIAAGAAAGAYSYYGPGYAYYDGYGPYYGPAYYDPGYAYYGGPYWRHRYYRPYW